MGEEWSVANAMNNLGLVAGYQNDYLTAHALHQESLGIFRALDERSGIAMAVGNLGHDAMHLGRLRKHTHGNLRACGCSVKLATRTE